jgi:hypothetical protein
MRNQEPRRIGESQRDRGLHGFVASERLTATCIPRETLIARFGGDVLMPDVRHLIAQCPRKDAPGAACGVYYADLRERSE